MEWTDEENKQESNPTVEQRDKSVTDAVVQKKATLIADDRGVFVGSTFEEQWRLACAYSKSGLVPQSLASPEKLMVAMQFARELGLPAITALRQIMVLNGTPAIYGDLPLSLVLRSGKLEDIAEEIMCDESSEPVKAVCTVRRKGIKTPTTRCFSMEDAKKAGLLNRDGPWKKYTKRMLQCRARAWALKDLFADTLNGIAIVEYDEHGDDQTHNPRRSSLNDRFIPDPVTKLLTGNLTNDTLDDKPNE